MRHSVRRHLFLHPADLLTEGDHAAEAEAGDEASHNEERHDRRALPACEQPQEYQHAYGHERCLNEIPIPLIAEHQ